MVHSAFSFFSAISGDATPKLTMFAVIVGLTGAGIGRLLQFGVSIPVLGLINLALLIAGPIYDLATRRSIHPVYRWGVPFAVLTFTPFRFVIGATPWWHHVAHLVTGS